jgi:hypothetical protein
MHGCDRRGHTQSYFSPPPRADSAQRPDAHPPFGADRSGRSVANIPCLDVKMTFSAMLGRPVRGHPRAVDFATWLSAMLLDRLWHFPVVERAGNMLRQRTLRAARLARE